MAKKRKRKQKMRRGKPLLTHAQQKQYVRAKIGKPVQFQYPEPSPDLTGTLEDRFATKVSEDADVVYWFMIDLIRFKGQPEEWVRMTYYRYRKTEATRGWNFGGQTSISGPRSMLKRFFVGGIEEKSWIRAFFEEVGDESLPGEEAAGGDPVGLE